MPTDHSTPSICIPRVFANVTKREVREVFEQVLGGGHACIERIDLISRTDQSGTPFGRVFIHLRFWPKTEQAQAVREQLLAGEQVKIVYDEPWYWKCGASRVPKPEFTRERAAPYVELKKEPKSDPMSSGNLPPALPVLLDTVSDWCEAPEPPPLSPSPLSDAETCECQGSEC